MAITVSLIKEEIPSRVVVLALDPVVVHSGVVLKVVDQDNQLVRVVEVAKAAVRAGRVKTVIKLQKSIMDSRRS